jgi:hypothetical protein
MAKSVNEYLVIRRIGSVSLPWHDMVTFNVFLDEEAFSADWALSALSFRELAWFWGQVFDFGVFPFPPVFAKTWIIGRVGAGH